MISRDRIIDAVYRAIDEVNEALAPPSRVEKSLGTALMGEDGTLDSLGIVNLAVTLEEKVEHEFGRVVPLARALDPSAQNNPFRKVDTLVEHIESLLSRPA